MNNEALRHFENNLVEAALSYALAKHSPEEVRAYFLDLLKQHKDAVQNWLMPQIQGGTEAV